MARNLSLFSSALEDLHALSQEEGNGILPEQEDDALQKERSNVYAFPSMSSRNSPVEGKVQTLTFHSPHNKNREQGMVETYQLAKIC